MGWMDKIKSGARKMGEEAEKALDKGKTKAEELRIEMKMDGLAKKLGYLAFDAHRGREVDAAAQTKLLADLTDQEAKLEKVKAEAAEKAAAEKEAKKVAK